VNDNPAFKAPPRNYFRIAVPSLESVGAKVIATLTENNRHSTTFINGSFSLSICNCCSATVTKLRYFFYYDISK